MKKGAPKVVAKVGPAKFNAASYVKPGVTEADVNEIKHSFDLFDTDQGGSVDLKGSSFLHCRIKSSNGFIRF